jgi:hypothetical protein
MLLPTLLALALVTGQSDPYGEDEDWEDGEPASSRSTEFYLVGWGGNAFDANGNAPSFGVLGAEAGLAFPVAEIGIATYGYHDPENDDEWTPVVLARIGNRFQSYRGLEGTLTFGIGAARVEGWKTWFQVALGVRLVFEPLFVAGEITFEQNNLIRLTGGLGARF